MKPRTVRELNQAVTNAILKMERAEQDYKLLLMEVLRLESSLYDVLPRGSLESDIAARGIKTAQEQLARLQ